MLYQLSYARVPPTLAISSRPVFLQNVQHARFWRPDGVILRRRWAGPEDLSRQAHQAVSRVAREQDDRRARRPRAADRSVPQQGYLSR